MPHGEAGRHTPISDAPAFCAPRFPLRASLQKRQLAQPTPRMPVMSPLPHRLPLATFAPVVVATSGFSEAQKQTIKLLLENLGGSFMGNFKPGETTHLMVPSLVGANDGTQKKVRRA
jgi:hypothetical protein